MGPMLNASSVMLQRHNNHLPFSATYYSHIRPRPYFNAHDSYADNSVRLMSNVFCPKYCAFQQGSKISAFHRLLHTSAQNTQYLPSYPFNSQYMLANCHMGTFLVSDIVSVCKQLRENHDLEINALLTKQHISRKLPALINWH